MPDKSQPRRTYQGKELRWVRINPQLFSWLSLRLAQSRVTSIIFNPSQFRTDVSFEVRAARWRIPLGILKWEPVLTDQEHAWIKELLQLSFAEVEELQFYGSGRLRFGYREGRDGKRQHLWFAWRPSPSRNSFTHG